MPRVIKLRPHITEKTLKLAKRGIYTFIGPVRYTKETVKEMLQTLFGSEVTSIRMVKIPAKERGKFLRRAYKKPARKKFYVKFANKTVKIPGFDNLK